VLIKPVYTEAGKYTIYVQYMGHAVAQLVEEVRYMPEGRG